MASDDDESFDHSKQGSNGANEPFSVVKRGGDMMQWAHDHKEDEKGKSGNGIANEHQGRKLFRPPLHQHGTSDRAPLSRDNTWGTFDRASLSRDSTWGTFDRASLVRGNTWGTLDESEMSLSKHLNIYDSSCDGFDKENERLGDTEDAALRSSPSTVQTGRESTGISELGELPEIKADLVISDSSTQEVEQAEAVSHADENKQVMESKGIGYADGYGQEEDDIPRQEVTNEIALTQNAALSSSEIHSINDAQDNFQEETTQDIKKN
eukprot:8921491-Ditylum_brightwellii.AAC.1